MTFEEFWKQSGWHSGGSEGCSEYHLAEDAYGAGYEAHAATVADALAGLRASLYGSLSESATDYSLGLNQSIMQLDATIAALGLQAAEKEER